MDINSLIREKLFALADDKYGDFCSRLIPDMERKRIIGIRTPQLRDLAKELAECPEIWDFLADLPHYYYEEDQLHSFIISRIGDFEHCLPMLERFLPYVDNWAVCDQLSPAVFKRHSQELLPYIKQWLDSAHIYTVRFGLGMLMRYYLDNSFKPEYLQMAAAIRSQEYYLMMMQAWFFATALAKQYQETIIYLQQRLLPVWVHNKTIRKAIESRRITAEQKAYLRTLAIK